METKNDFKNEADAEGAIATNCEHKWYQDKNNPMPICLNCGKLMASLITKEQAMKETGNPDMGSLLHNFLKKDT